VSETTARVASDIHYQVKIDLSMNVPPQPVEAKSRDAHRAGSGPHSEGNQFTALLNYQRPGGSEEERAIAANWLRTRAPAATTERLIVYPGTQAALFNTLLSLTSPGDVVLTEALTFPGIKAAAAKLGCVCRRCRWTERALIRCAQRRVRTAQAESGLSNPDLHHPTTITLAPERRRAVADIIRNAGLS